MRLIARTEAQLRQAYERLRNEKVIAIDSETTGLDPYTTVIHSVQLSNEAGDFSVLVPRSAGGFWADAGKRFTPFTAPSLGPLLGLVNSPAVLKLGQNTPFDIKMMYHHYSEFRAVRWYDTMVAERVLTAGLYKKTSLADITHRYLGKERDKQIRTTFYDGTWDGFTWTDDLVDYALEDVEDLGKIFRMQMAKLKEQELIPTAQLEMSLLPIWARMELRGIGYDKEGGEEFAADMRAKASSIEPELQALLEPHWRMAWEPVYQEQKSAWDEWKAEWEIIKSETSKRKGLSNEQIEAQKLRRATHRASEPKRPTIKDGKINLGSSTQLLPTLKATGLYLENTKKETLEELAGANEHIDLLLEWRMYDKLANTFGQPLLEQINSVTCRIHPSFNPIVATGRCSCYSPNLQQIPQKTDQGKRLRKLFVAGKGKKLVVADYSGIELVIIAVLSGDEVLLDAINRNLDLHSTTISYALSEGEIREEVYESLVAIKDGKGTEVHYEIARRVRKNLERIADIPLLSKRGWDDASMFAWVKNLRDYFKTTTYGIAYGLSKYGLARRLHFSIDAAETIINLLFQTYPKVRDMLQQRGKDGLENQFSLTISGRKRFFKLPYPVTRARIEEKSLSYIKQAEAASQAWDADVIYRMARRELQKEYNSRISSIQRQAGNAPIQGTSADMTKLAMLYVEQEVQRVMWGLDEGLLLPVHDELIAEVYEEHAEQMRDIMKWQMERAAMEILGPLAPDLKIVVNPEIADYWKH